MKNDYYIVRDLTEECFCAECGMLIYINERVYPNEDGSALYCSKECKQKGEHEYE